MALAPDCFYLPGAINRGVVRASGDRAVLIDSGLDDDHAKKLAKACRAAGLEPAAVVTTHAHADHCGGNAFFAERCGLPIYGPPLESAILSYPYLEPLYLFSGAHPPAALQTKWLMARPAAVPPERELAGPEATIAGTMLGIVPLPGHAPGMIGIAVGDVLYAADGVFSPTVLAKYGLPFASDVGAQLASIETVREGRWQTVLPAHGEPTPRAELDALCNVNRNAIHRGLDLTLAAAAGPVETETVVSVVSTSLGLALTTLAVYHLLKTTVMAYLSHWLAAGRLRAAMRGNRMWWEAV